MGTTPSVATRPPPSALALQPRASSLSTTTTSRGARHGRRRRRRGATKPSRFATRPPPSRPPFDGLPREIVHTVQSFLLGVDLLTLSHVSRRLYHALASPHVWNARMANYDFNPAVYGKFLQDTAKMRYAQGRSLKFPGVAVDSKRIGHHDRGGSVALPRIVRMFHLDPISFDLWFCLLPPSQSDDGRRVYTGGVLFGSQSEAAFARHSASQYEHIVHVDADRNLYCSLMWQKPVVASKLSFNRWYHVALSFNGEEERVYVSGKLMNIDTSRQMTAWSDLPFAQLGSGMLSARSPGRPTPDFHGWYGFFGLIDDFRIWNHALTGEQIQKLARGEYVKTSPSYRLKRVVGTATCGRVQSVRCSRPIERVVEIVALRSKKKKLHQWLKKVRRSSTESASCISIRA